MAWRIFAQLVRQLRILAPTQRHVRAGHRDVGHYVVEFQPRLTRFRHVEKRLFDKEDRMFTGEARQELLRSLPDKAPAASG